MPALVSMGEQTEHNGGSPLLFQHLFWFFGHPEVYIVALPAFGIVSDLLSTHARKNIFGYRMMVWAIVAIGALSFVVWAHHMYVSGMNPYFGFFFATTTLIIAMPDRDQGLQLGADAVARRHPPDGADAVRDRLHLHVRARRAHRAVPRQRDAWTCRCRTRTSWSRTSTWSWACRRSWWCSARSITGSRRSPADAGRPSATSTSGSRSSGPTRSICRCTISAFSACRAATTLRRQHGLHPGLGAHVNDSITIARDRGRDAQVMFLFNIVYSLIKGKTADANPWRAASLEWQTPRHAAGAWQLGAEAAGRPSLGLRLQRAGAKEDFIPQNEPPQGHSALG